jgi:hypothetical protein
MSSTKGMPEINVLSVSGKSLSVWNSPVLKAGVDIVPNEVSRVWKEAIIKLNDWVMVFPLSFLG